VRLISTACKRPPASISRSTSSPSFERQKCSGGRRPRAAKVLTLSITNQETVLTGALRVNPQLQVREEFRHVLDLVEDHGTARKLVQKTVGIGSGKLVLQRIVERNVGTIWGLMA
jgi:hypothetical protein